MRESETISERDEEREINSVCRFAVWRKATSREKGYERGVGLICGKMGQADLTLPSGTTTHDYTHMQCLCVDNDRALT